MAALATALDQFRRIGPTIAPRPPQPGLVAGAPALPTPPLLPNTPGAPTAPNIPPPGTPEPISAFGPGSDLRFSQINPTSSGRLTGVQGQTDQAAAALSAAPSLASAGAQQLAELRQQTAEDRKTGIQDIGRSAATFGRLGSGVTTGQLGDLEALLQKRQTAAETGLAGDLARQQGTESRANLASLSGLESQQVGQEAGQRGELRGERGYQTDTVQQSLQNDIQRKTLEDALLNSQYGRAATQAGAKLTGGQILSAQGAGQSGAASDLLSSLSLDQYLKKLKDQQAGFTRV